MVLAISGDFRRADLIARLNKAFTGWKSQKVTLPELPPIRPADSRGEDARQVYHVPKAVPQSSIVLGNLGVSRHDPDRIPLEVMDYILGRSGFSSRLVREIPIQSGPRLLRRLSLLHQRAGGLAGAYSFTRADATCAATALMLEIFWREFGKEPVPDAELQGGPAGTRQFLCLSLRLRATRS